jgi:hypothetical protein
MAHRGSNKKIGITNREKNGDDFYVRIGAIGGKTITENTKKRGFASASQNNGGSGVPKAALSPISLSTFRLEYEEPRRGKQGWKRY